MRFRYGFCTAVALTILVLLCAGSGNADPLAFSYSGTFVYDTDYVVIPFDLSTSTPVTVETWSFGGGVDATGQIIPAGGFFPYLEISDSAGNLIPWAVSGNINCEGHGCNPDPVTGYYYDAYINVVLPAGSYDLYLSEYDNMLLGPNVSDGFSESDPLFSQQWWNPENSCDPPNPLGCANPQNAPFLLYSSGEKRDGNWEVDIVFSPEPASLALAVAGLALLFLPRALGVRRVR